MEKMIKVINDNLRTVISGIKTHKSDTESSLATVQGKMDERVKLAGEYRSNVEDSRQIISTLENEISTLENDLDDLKKKFDSKDFREILVVGSKEINNKIAEKKSLIAEQSQRIIALTEKAHKLKNELVALKEKKLSLESTLEKDNILEAYYENRIMEVINFSEKHTEDLKEYIDVEPQPELMTSTNEVENIDITSVIDGSVFEEIDEISNSTDGDELSEYINDVLDEGTIDLNDLDLDYEDEEESSDEDDDNYATAQIDDIINQANDLLEKSKNIEGVNASNDDSEIIADEPLNLDEVDEISEPVPLYIDDGDDESSDDEGLTLSLNNDENLLVDEDIPEVEPYKPEENITDEEYENALLDSPDVSDIFPTLDIDVPEVPIDNGIGTLGELTLTAPEDLDLEEADVDDIKAEEDSFDSVDEENMFTALANFDAETNNFPEIQIDNDPLKEKDEVENDAPLFNIDEKEDNDDAIAELEEANLDVSKFSSDDIESIKEKYVKNNIVNIVYTMRKHNIAISRIYECANILSNSTAEQLDYILTLLEKTNASSDSLSYVFGLLDRVDIYKLEEKLSAKTNYELSELLYDVIPYEGEVDLENILNLSSNEVSILRSESSTEEFEKINQFSDIIKANYNELKKYNVNNLNECITRHPHRFLFNPDNFAAILDKYDTEDLTRCVNKNAAVIDKL